MTPSAALRWCSTHHATVRFDPDGSVTVKVAELRRSRPTFTQAVEAMVLHLATVERQP